ncbi:hypothetical protein HK099_007407 [Clydaea vesicula]|uniref:Homing endonuclease LAGLIDADG domain-containing protein n=1 Tax=Clydaea vesicula TaxID=447962 RepID=A0AAD5TWG4_9FUNG|nr:hypothetical protein HK099_007407 [Clydaea vesicula]
MHINNIEALKIIKSLLNVGNVTVEENRNCCSFVVQDFTEIKDVICPIFLQYPLLTSKNLDFKDFYKAIIIKNKNNLSLTDKEKIILLKNGMNSKRKIFTSFSINSQINVSPEWFIGFFEGEGTFGIKTGSSLYFQVAQKNTSIENLNAIITFLTNLKATQLKKNSQILPLNVVSIINKKTDVISLVVSSVDAIYYYLLPLLDTSKMYTNKVIDFKLWRMALILKIYGYYYLSEGKTLFLDISDILNKRYNPSAQKNINLRIEEIFNRYQLILLKNPPFNVENCISHVDNVRDYRLKIKSDIQKTIYIYENGKLIKGSPFSSFSNAHKALGLKSTSNTCNRYLDTNRLYKSKFIFTSKHIL